MKRRSKLIFLILLAATAAGNVRADWVKQPTKSFAWYKDIFFIDAERGWIAGTDGTLLSTEDGGTTWTPTKKFTNDAIIQVHFTDASNGWLLCERNVFARGNDATSYLRKTIDGGRTWEKIEFEDGGRERVTKLLFNNDKVGSAFGEGGVFYTLQEDGRTWKRSKTAIHYLLLDGAYSGDRIGAIVGTGGTVMFTEDGGFTWSRASLLGDNETRFSSIFFAGSRGAWAVGSRGRIFYSNGGARLWRQQDSSVTADLNDVYFKDERRGWAVGDHGVIVQTRDAGQNWSSVDSHVTHRLEKVVFAGSRGYIIGYGGTLLSYTDTPTPRDTSGRPQLQRRN